VHPGHDATHLEKRLPPYTFDPLAQRALVAAAQRGEPEARARLVQRLQCIPRFVARLHGRMGWSLSQEELADAVQDVALVVLKNLDRFHGRVPLEAWIHRICFLTLRNRLRRQRASPKSLGDAAEDVAAPRAESGDDTRAEVMAILDRIGGIEADIVSMRHIEGLSFEEIGRRTGDSVATTKTRYYRAIRRVQERLHSRQDDIQGAEHEARRRG
jgi:RNA polymerase sigma-70 factor (ECF subfamily)